MNFASKFPTVARLLSGTANVSADEELDPVDPPADDPPADDPPADDPPADDPPADDPPSDDASASLAAIPAAERSALQSAFTRDANAQVSAAQQRCIDVFTSEPGTRAPNAAARLLNKTSMSAADIIETLKDTGATSRAQDRSRLRGSGAARPDTGQAEEPATATEAARKTAKERRQDRNKAMRKKGGVKANRTEFDDGTAGDE